MEEWSVSGKYKQLLKVDLDGFGTYTMIKKDSEKADKMKQFCLVKLDIPPDTDEPIENFVCLHTQKIHEYVNSCPPHSRLMCIYDLSATSNRLPSMSQVMKFVTCQANLKDLYKTFLRGTMIIVSDQVHSEFLNNLLTTMYIPSKPVRFVDSKANIQEEIRSFWKECC